MAANKNLRKIVVDKIDFVYVINKMPKYVTLRVYSAIYKSTYMEFDFDYKDYYNIKLHRPKVVEILIRYGLNKGWKCEEKGNVSRIVNTKELIGMLNLKEYD